MQGNYYMADLIKIILFHFFSFLWFLRSTLQFYHQERNTFRKESSAPPIQDKTWLQYQFDSNGDIVRSDGNGGVGKMKGLLFSFPLHIFYLWFTQEREDWERVSKKILMEDFSKAYIEHMLLVGELLWVGMVGLSVGNIVELWMNLYHQISARSLAETSDSA